MAKTIDVLLADDQILFVESLKTVLETRTEDIRVIGIAHNGLEALELVEKTRPDLILMDVRMPKMDGVEATKRIKEQYKEIQIVMLTTFDDDDYVQEALQHGAVGYMLKDIPPSELISSIRAIKEGAFLVSREIASKLVLKAYQELPAGSQTEFPPWLKELSKREREVLYLISQGLDNKDIARKLFLAEQTVKNHVSDIYFKIGTHDRIKVMQVAQSIQKYLKYL